MKSLSNWGYSSSLLFVGRTHGEKHGLVRCKNLCCNPVALPNDVCSYSTQLGMQLFTSPWTITSKCLICVLCDMKRWSEVNKLFMKGAPSNT